MQRPPSATDSICLLEDEVSSPRALFLLLFVPITSDISHKGNYLNISSFGGTFFTILLCAAYFYTCQNLGQNDASAPLRSQKFSRLLLKWYEKRLENNQTP